MAKLYTRQGLDLIFKQIKTCDEEVRSIGRQVGEAAGANCDWHDNFAYEDAKRRLEIASTMLHQLREEASGAQVIVVEEQSDKVGIGVTVEALLDGKAKVVTIGAYGESDPEFGLISYFSPLGRALLRMEVGDTKTAPLGPKQVRIEVQSIMPPSYRYHNQIAEYVRKQLASNGLHGGQ